MVWAWEYFWFWYYYSFCIMVFSALDTGNELKGIKK